MWFSIVGAAIDLTGCAAWHGWSDTTAPAKIKGDAPGLKRGAEIFNFVFIMARNFENLRNDKRNGKQFAYILDSIDHEGSDREKLAYFFECFAEEFDHEYTRRRWPNLAERNGQYLQGLPSCCAVAFRYWAISEQGR